MNGSPDSGAPRARTQPLPFRGVPEAVFAGGWSAYITTDMGEWAQAGAMGEVKALPPLPAYTTAVVGADDRLVVALCEPLLAVVRNGAWEYLDRPSPVLALARRGSTLLLGDAAGRIMAGDPAAGDVTTLAVAERPVTELLAEGDDVVFLDGRAGIVLGGQANPAYAETGWLGRPFLLFGSPQRRRVGLAAQTQTALLDLDSARLASTSDQIEDAVRSVIPLSGRPAAYAVVSDGGQLWLLDDGLRASAVRLPQSAEEVAGCAAAGAAGLLVWTRARQLFRVNARRTVVAVRKEEVVCAAAMGTTLLILKWSSEEGARIEWAPLGGDS